MSTSKSGDRRGALRNWLRSERRLGIPHVSAPLPASGANLARDRPASRRQPREKPDPSPAPSSATTTRPASARRPTVYFDLAPELPAVCADELSVDAARAALDELDRGCVRGCERCSLSKTRRQTVFGVGHARPSLVFVGEGPGADEDAAGEPFVGRAGQLLTKMIAAMGLQRSDVYICNTVKCRPPGNRTPTDAEMSTCGPFLLRQLAILRPRVIVTLGRPAAQALLGVKTPIGRLRGQFHDFPSPSLSHYPNLPRCRLMPTFHPAYLLRSPGEKGKAWADLQQVMAFLGLKVPTGRS